MRRTACILLLFFLGAGCITLTPVDGNNGGGDGDGDSGQDGGDGSDGERLDPMVSIRVSNPSPQLNEEVIVTCELTGGEGAGVEFTFESNGATLSVDASGGAARFVVTESEISTTIVLSCTATDRQGVTSQPDSTIVVPTG